MHTLQCLGLFNFPYFVHFFRNEPSAGSHGPGLPTSFLPAWPAPSRSPPVGLPPETRGQAGPRSSWQCWVGRGGVQRRGPGEDILVSLCFPPPHPPPPPRRLDHWLTFSPAPKVLRRHWVCILVWLSSLLFPGDGEGGNFGGVGEKWGPWRRGPSRWAAGAPGKRWKEGRRAGRPVLGEGGQSLLESKRSIK